MHSERNWLSVGLSAAVLVLHSGLAVAVVTLGTGLHIGDMMRMVMGAMPIGPTHHASAGGRGAHLTGVAAPE